MPVLLNLPAIQGPRNALLDLSGVNNAIDDWRKRGEAEARKQSVRDIGQQWANKDYDGATNTALQYGDPELATRMLGLSQQKQSFDEDQQNKALAKLAAIYQHIGTLPPDQQDAHHDRVMAADPRFQNVFKKLPEYVRGDKRLQREFVMAVTRGYKDPLEQQMKQAQLATEQTKPQLNADHSAFYRSQADQGKYVPYDPTRPLYDTKAKTFVQPPPQMQNENPYEATARKKQAELAPAEYKATMEAHSNANNMLNTASSMKVLINQANVGKFSELRTDAQQVLRQFGYGQREWDDKVARTQLLKGLLAPLVGQLGKEFKPLSNSDVAFITKAAGDPTLSPATLQHIAGALEAEAKRQILYNRAIGEQLKRGQFPDYAAIADNVRQTVPSYYDSMFGQKQNQPRVSETMQPNAPQQPQPNSARAQQLQTAPLEHLNTLDPKTLSDEELQIVIQRRKAGR